MNAPLHACALIDKQERTHEDCSVSALMRTFPQLLSSSNVTFPRLLYQLLLDPCQSTIPDMEQFLGEKSIDLSPQN